eukprot:m.174184 g.174184  ORF g.174184 m.174184 type:complete len:51 (+) comp31756_c0_seq2:224-376(+)
MYICVRVSHVKGSKSTPPHGSNAHLLTPPSPLPSASSPTPTSSPASASPR